MSIFLAYVTSVLSLLFAASLLGQYMTRRQPYHLLWAVALLLFSVAMGVWFLRETFGLNPWIFRLWYLSGAMLVPAFLGTGVVYMIAPRKVASAFLGYLLVVTAASVVLVLTADFKTPNDCLKGLEGLECLLPSHTLTSMGFFPPWIRILGALLNVYGGLAILAGAVVSLRALGREEKRLRREEGIGPSGVELPAGTTDVIRGAVAESSSNTVLGIKLLWRNRKYWREEILPQRAVSNLILITGLVLGALGATLNILEAPEPHLALFLAAVVIIYLGFLASEEVFDISPHHQLRDSIETFRATRFERPAILQQILGRLPFRRQPGGDVQ